MAIEAAFPPAVQSYLDGLHAVEPTDLAYAIEAAETAGMPRIEVGPHEGRFLAVMAAAVGAHRALEIGTLAGYSGLWITRGLEPDGTLVTIESDVGHAAVARDVFRRAGLASRVTLRLGAALEVLPRLEEDGGKFDLVFIDADKENYPAYLDWAIRLARPGAAILAHNTFLGGEVVASDGTPRNTAMREFNQRLVTDSRLLSAQVPLRDGISVSIVREDAGR